MVECISKRNLGSNEGEGIASSLRCQSRRTAQARVDFDDTVVVSLSVECELNIALTHNAQVLYTLNSDFLQHFNLLLAQRASRRNYDGFASMDTQWVEILHRGNGKATVVSIADALKLDFLPALQTLFNQNLWSESKGRLGQLDELLLIGTDT